MWTMWSNIYICQELRALEGTFQIANSLSGNVEGGQFPYRYAKLPTHSEQGDTELTVLDTLPD